MTPKEEIERCDMRRPWGLLSSMADGNDAIKQFFQASLFGNKAMCWSAALIEATKVHETPLKLDD